MKILFVANPLTLGNLFVKDYLRSFELFSRHEIRYVAEIPRAESKGERMVYGGLEFFDAVVVTFHVRVCMEGWVSTALCDALKRYRGLKVLFLQDEYDRTEHARRWIEEHGVHLVYTVVPESHVGSVYSPDRFPRTVFRSVLTGYAPIRRRPAEEIPPIRERPYHVVYRGRVSPPWLGRLAREKEEIGRRMQRICEEERLPHDIQWDERERIYGLDWRRFLRSGRATLGSESGANVFDEKGGIRAWFERGLQAGGDRDDLVPPAHLDYREENLGVRMNQISPRLFEAIAEGTALVLYEGEYSGVLQAGRHYLPLRKDFGNVGEVVAALEDPDRLQEIADRAYADIIESGRYGYDALVRRFDDDVESIAGRLETRRARELGAAAAEVGEGRLVTGDFSDLAATGAAWHKKRLEETKGRLAESWERLEEIRERLGEMRERLRVTRERLGETRERLAQTREHLGQVRGALKKSNRELAELKGSRIYRLMKAIPLSGGKRGRE